MQLHLLELAQQYFQVVQNLNHSNAGDYAILQHTNGTTYLNSRSGQKMHFRISNTDKMVMLSNGNIGINSIRREIWQVMTLVN